MRAPARPAAALALLLAAACTSERLPTSAVPTDARAPIAAVASADVPAATAAPAALAEPVVIGPVNISADERPDGSDYLDPDAGGGAGVDDGVCDDAPGLDVGARVCSLRAAIQNHNAHPGVVHRITFTVDSVRLSGDVFAASDGTLILDGSRAGGGRTVLQGPWAASSSAMPALMLNVCNSRVAGLVVAGFAGGAIQIVPGSRCAGVGSNLIEDNFLGTDRLGRPLAGGMANAASSGVYLGSPGNVVRRNVIAGFGHGVQIVGPTADGNQVMANVIGLAADTLTPVAGGVGVQVKRGPSGGAAVRRAVVDGNVIVASAEMHAVSISGADSSRIENNRIGINRLGNVFPHAIGISIASAMTSLQRHVVRSNQIAGSRSDGIAIAESADNEVTANVITGVGRDGIAIGGRRTAVTGNRVERSGDDGIQMSTTGGDAVRGNMLLTNGGAGVNARSAQGLVVADNPRIEGNARDGVVIGGAGTVSGNTIAGNGGAGVLVAGAQNLVKENTITANLGAGVAVESPLVPGATSRNTIRGNAISANGGLTGLGIDLGTPGVTPNDAGDADPGANGLQNFPVLTAATTAVAKGTLESTAGTTFQLHFYGSAACDPSGYGEGERYLGAGTVTTGASGSASFTIPLALAPAAGSHLTATATDPAGSTSELSACRAVVVDPPGPPVAVAGGPYVGVEGSAVVFDGSRSYDPTREPITHAWSFGDGSGGTTAGPSKVYAASGTFPVTLVVRDPGGLTGSASTTATIANVAPAVDLRMPAGPLVVGTPLSFPHLVTDPGGAGDAPFTVTIAWGDGTSETRTVTSAAALLDGTACPTFCTTHVYAAPGSYTARMTVTDKDLGTASDEVTVVFANNPPAAVAGGPYVGVEGTPITFSGAGSSDPEKGALTYRWSFGDGTSSTLANPSKAYADNGTYTVTLVVTDPAGATGSATTTATIGNAAPAVTLRALGPTTVVAGTVVSVEGSFTDPGPNDGPWRHFLSFGLAPEGPGSTYAGPGTPIGGGQRYDAPGTYTVRLRVEDRDGASGSAQLTVTVLPNAWSGWQGVGSGMAGAPVLFASPGGRVDLFVRSGDGVLWHRPFVGSWQAWQSLGVVASNPAVTTWGDGRLDVFVRGTDGALWHRLLSGGVWGPWQSRGGAMLGTPAAVAWGPGRLDVFIRGTDNALWHMGWQDGYGWSAWEAQGGGMSADPVAVSWGVGRLDVFIRGTDNALWYKYFQGGWSGWIGLGGALAGAPAAASWGPGRLDVFIRGATDNALWHLGWQQGYGWSAWEPQGGSLTSEPAVVASGVGRLDVFVRGTDSGLHHKYFSGGWTGWFPRGGSLAAGPAAAPRGVGWVDVAALAPDGVVWHKVQTP